MNIVNISKLRLNDSHNYFGGAIGNIAYNQISSLANLDGVTVETAAEGVDFKNEQPDSLSITTLDEYEGVRSFLDSRLSKADVVTHLYFHEPEYNPVSQWVANTEVPFVIGMCEVPHPRFNDEVSGIERLPFVRRIGKRLLMPRFKRTLNSADRLIVVNEHAKQYYSDYYPEEQIRIIPYGVSLERFRPSDFPEKPRVLMVNRLIKRRGIDHMITAFRKVRDALSQAELHIVGEGPRREELASQTVGRDIDQAVTFHGNVSASELVQQYSDATVFSHLSYADGWNQPALEAMASGRPVVCTDKPHNSMVVDGETGYKIPWNDPETLADRLIKLLSNSTHAERLGKAGRERAESIYLWPKIAEQYRQALAEVMKRG